MGSPDSKFIKKERGKGPGFVKRGTPAAQRAENQEKARNRAKEMAKARIAAKKAEMSEQKKIKVSSVPAPDMKYIMSHGMSDQTFADTAKKTFSSNPADKTIGKDGYSTANKFTAELMRRTANTGKDFSGNPLYGNKKDKTNIKSSYEYDAYDLVLEYLLSSEQAATIEEANYVMTEMDAETIQGIVEEQKKTLTEKPGDGYIGPKFLNIKNPITNYINKKRDESPIGGNKRVDDTRKGSGDDKVGEKIYFK